MRTTRKTGSPEAENAAPWSTKQKALWGIGLLVLLGLYAAAMIVTPRVSRSQDFLAVENARLPVSAFTGVISSLGNICIICLVVFYRKPGFIIALVLLLAQTPLWIRNTIIEQNPASIPGIASSILTVLAVILIRSRDKRITKYQAVEVERLQEREQMHQRLFEQTATALVTAIDAKDEYSHGHSIRVAEYAERIAREMGKSDDECRKIYYAGLLHDVGKLGVPDGIINKKGKLTPEEYEQMKQHPVLGSQILASIRDFPYISIAARYHHERYDGKGYPDGLKGEDIPEVARIIAVADAYDVMSSNRSYRSAIPQQLIREEIIAGVDTQFDPEMAMIMRHMIDRDSEYRMKEREAVRELAGDNVMYCEGYRSRVSDGVVLTHEVTVIHLAYRDEDPDNRETSPVLILFDSLDGRVHDDEKAIRSLVYYEYGEIRLNGGTKCPGSRAVSKRAEEHPARETEGPEEPGRKVYDIEAVKCRDHVLIRIDDGKRTTEVTVALPDCSRYAYLALTGEHCYISDVTIGKTGKQVADDYIPRIAEEVSYIDVPAGDIPNVQVDGVRTASSEGVPVTDGLRLSFHSISLPTARLIWHCPYIVLYFSADGKMNGRGYREYTVIRLDGETWDDDPDVTNKVVVNRTPDFDGWDAWKAGNKAGLDCVVTFLRDGNKIITSTENLGLSLKGVTLIPGGGERPVYAALTGDQVALTDIRVS